MNTRSKRGFSIPEMLVSMAILSLLMATITLLMGRIQALYTTQQRVGGVNETGKTAMELMALDISQAGYPGMVNALTQAAISGSSSNQTVTLNNMRGIYVGRMLTVDVGNVSTEPVRVVSCTTTSTVANGCTSGGSNSVTALFKLDHANNSPVTASLNPLPEGIPFDLADTVGTFSSSQSTLRIIGDLRSDGTLRYIEYRFTAAPATCTGTLVRSDTDAYAATQNAGVTIANNLCNTAAAGIFTYTSPCQAGVTLTATQLTYITLVNTDFTPGSAVCRPLGNYSYLDSTGATVTRSLTYVTNIGVTLQMQTQAAIVSGIGTGGTRTIVFKEQYFSPRNVVDALLLDDDGLQTLLPVAPRAALSSLPAAP